MLLRELTIETAKAMEGQVFDVVLPGGETIQLSLDQALPYEMRQRRPTRGAPFAARAPFSLYFLGPPDQLLAQGMYEFGHATAPLGQIFIVPVGQDAQASEYEAVFS